MLSWKIKKILFRGSTQVVYESTLLLIVMHNYIKRLVDSELLGLLYEEN